ncbi:MAG: ABC transporter permease subunit [Thermoanaerobaculales bacterium]|nr:ABC transporter permease subunit [Thermoanaerobaculales bacterium]
MTDTAPDRVPPPGAAAKAPAGVPARAPVARGGPRIRARIPGWQRWVLGVVPVLALVGIWWFLTGDGPAEERIISPAILPSPMEVLRSFPKLWFERALTRNTFVSFSRVVAGFAVGLAVAFPLGLLMGAFTRVKAAFTPLSVFGAYLPIPALVPVTLSLFGTGERQKVLFLALAFLIYLLPLIVAAVDGVDEVYLKTAYTLGATPSQAVTKVLLAVSWPSIYQAMRLGFGIGWSYIILAEMVDIGRGVGGIIIISQRQGPREHIYLVLVVIVAVAFVVDKIWEWGGKLLFPYREAA